jgi:hypothetical protein
MDKLNCFITSIVLFCFTNFAYAWPNVYQVIPPGQFAIAGTPVACGPAPTGLTDNSLGDLAKTNSNGIYINWAMFQQMPVPVQLFTYAHECGHINQILNGLPIDEDQADLFAIQLGKSQNFWDINSIQTVCQFLWSSAGDWTHKPGPVRCTNMLNTFPQLP